MSLRNPLSTRTYQSSSTPGNSRTEQGSALPLMVVAILLTAGLAVQIARLGGVAAARAQAQTAADAASLAGAADGPEAARALAEANGARIVAYREEGLDTRVEVSVGPARAVGRATRAGSGIPSAR